MLQYLTANYLFVHGVIRNHRGFRSVLHLGNNDGKLIVSSRFTAQVAHHQALVHGIL